MTDTCSAIARAVPKGTKAVAFDSAKRTELQRQGACIYGRERLVGMVECFSHDAADEVGAARDGGEGAGSDGARSRSPERDRDRGLGEGGRGSRLGGSDRARMTRFVRYSALPRAAWPRSRKVLGNFPLPQTLNDPKSLYHSPSGTSDPGSSNRLRRAGLPRKSFVPWRDRGGAPIGALAFTGRGSLLEIHLPFGPRSWGRRSSDFS
jgi:hypothetical protein